MVSTDLEGLVQTHDQPGLLVLAVLQQPHVTSATLLPLLAIPVKSEQLSAHLKGLLLEFFVGLGINFLRQADDGLEVDFGGFGSFLLDGVSICIIL